MNEDKTRVALPNMLTPEEIEDILSFYKVKQAGPIDDVDGEIVFSVIPV